MFQLKKIKAQPKKGKKAQTAMEYMILTGLVVGTIMVAFRLYVPRVNVATCQYFNSVVDGLYDGRVNALFLQMNNGE